MPRPTTRKRSASLRITEQATKRSESHQKRRRAQHVDSLKKVDVTQQLHQPVLSCFPEQMEIEHQHEENVVSDNYVLQNASYISRQQLPLHLTQKHHLKPFSAVCNKCFATHWIEEKTTNSTMKSPEFSTCCAAGKVDLSAPVCPPRELAKYLFG